MTDEKTRNLIARHEGRVEHAYQDSLGYWTIGVGHLIDERKGGSLPGFIIDALFEYDYAEHKFKILAVEPWIRNLDDVRKGVLFDMSFNLGARFLDGWPIFKGQVQRGEYQAAADNMRSTKWARQVKSRAQVLALMMETGEWPEGV